VLVKVKIVTLKPGNLKKMLLKKSVSHCRQILVQFIC